MRHLQRLALAAAAGVLAAGCSGSPGTGNSQANNSQATGSQSSAKAPGSSGATSVTIANVTGDTWTCGFNPFNSSVNLTSFGEIYEPLVFVNTLQSGKTTPMLAQSYAWSNSNKTLTFTIRKGVKWTDGTPLTAADVAFTFNLLHKDRGLDLNSVWSVLSSVQQHGDTVVMNFTSSGAVMFYYIADQVPIVPQHIWASLSNPVTYADKKPVGTGPYTLKSCSAQNIAYQANPGYWQGAPKIKTVNYPAYTDNNPANNDLAHDQDQWGAQFIPNIDKVYTSVSPSHHTWFPPVSNVAVFPNLTVAPLNDVKVRQALAYAVDRNKVSQIGEYGYEPAANQAGIVTPTFNSWLDSGAVNQYHYSYDPGKVASLLQGDGYAKDSSGIWAKNGSELALSIINIGDYSDWVSSLQVMQQTMKQAGIKLTIDNLSSQAYDDKLFKGQFQLAYYAEPGGPTPYYEMRQWLFSGNTAPIGSNASTNYERYRSAAADALFNQYSATDPSNTQALQGIVKQIEHIMLTEVPIIPVVESVDWYEYNDAQITGWPTQHDAYAQPSPYIMPDVGIVLTHLAPK